MTELQELAAKTNAWACYDCGKCTATCPITRAGADYSPRSHVLHTNLGNRPEIVKINLKIEGQGTKEVE